MSLTGAQYQRVDLAAVKLFFDATLTATLDLSFSWRGFFSPLDEVGTLLSSPTVLPVLPAAGMLYELRYTATPRAFSETMLTRQAVIDARLRRQPTSDGDVWDSILEAVENIKARISSLSTDLAHGITNEPVLRPQVRNKWHESRFLIPVFLARALT